MTHLLFALLLGGFFLGPTVAINGISEERARLILRAMDKAFTAAGMLTLKERYTALGYDASQYSRILALEKHPSIYNLLSVPNTKYLISFLSDLLFELVKETATEIVRDLKGRVA